jgi:hypothetical protein
MQPVHRISTIKRLYPDEWVVVEVTRVSRANRALAGRVLAHAREEHEITRKAIKAADEHPEAELWTFYTGDPIPEGMIVILGCL